MSIQVDHSFVSMTYNKVFLLFSDDSFPQNEDHLGFNCSFKGELKRKFSSVQTDEMKH